MEMPPPSSMPMRRPAGKRVLPPVPVEPGAQMNQASASASVGAAPVSAAAASSNPAASTADAAATHAAAEPATQSRTPATRPTEHTLKQSPEPAPAPVPSSIYTLPLWSAAPLHEWHLDVIKDGREVDSIPLRGKSHFLFGRQGDLCDVVLDHASVSRRHCVLQFHENGSLWLFDLGTAHGTYRNRQRVAPNTFTQINVGDMIKFAASTRVYVVEGPDEFRPKEVDRDLVARHNEQMRRQHAEREAAAQSQAARQPKRPVGADADSGTSWGQAEDAVDSDDEEEDGRMASLIVNDDGTTSVASSTSGVSLPAKLTPQQQKLSAKIDQKREKLTHLSSEVETLRAKDIRQGGLTEGQEKQIAKNEERMQALGTEIDQLENNLRESIERVADDREKNRSVLEARAGVTTNKKRRGDDDDDDEEAGSDSDDDFYDRTKSKPVAQATASTTTVDSSSVLSSLTPIASLTTPELIATELRRIESKRDQLRLTLQEVAMSEVKSRRAASSDSLDSFMGGIASDALTARKSALKLSLQELQAHHVKLTRLAEQKKGEAVTKKYMEGDKDAFKNAQAESKMQQGEEAVADASTSRTTEPHSQPLGETSSAPTTTTAATPATSAPVSAGGVSSTADALARLRRKQEAAARKAAEAAATKEKLTEMSRALAAVTPHTVRAFAADAPPAESAAERYARLAAEMDAARSSQHRNYDLVADDEVSRSLKASAARSAASMSSGLVGDEQRGGLHVRKRASHEDDARDEHAKRTKHTLAHSAERIVGPTGPHIDLALQRQQEEASVEWTPPVATAAGQEKLRAKFAGRY